MAFNLGAIHHVSIVVADTATALEFYSGVLGLAVASARPDLGYPGVWLDIGSQQIHLLEVDNVDPVTGRPAYVGRDRHIAFNLDNIEALAQQLARSNIDYNRSRSGRKALFCRDPDGNGLEFVEQAK